MEYVEREDEFDTYPVEEMRKRRADREDEDVDILSGAPAPRTAGTTTTGEDDDEMMMMGEDE